MVAVREAVNASLTERETAIAEQWDRHGGSAILDPSRLQHGRLIFSPLQHFYASCFDDFEAGLPNALDLGCGSGDNLIRLVQTGVVRHATGLEVSAQMVANAEQLRRHFGIPADRFRIVRGSVEAIDLPERFSLILATQILGYIDDVDAFMRRAAGFVAPDGYLFVPDRARRSLTPIQAVKNAAWVRRLFG